MRKKVNPAPKTILEEDLFAEYSDLLTRRDQLIKDSESYNICYTKEFGQQIIANFELKLECIKLKKSISYCRRVLNRGQNINVNCMNEAVGSEMTLYKVQLRNMQIELNVAKNSTTVDSFRASRSKKIYRRLSKMIHPDVNAKTETNEKLRELWERVSVAYHTSNAEELEDLEILVRKTLEDLGDAGFEIDMEGIEDRIDRVERQINDIITSDPYTYKDILSSEEKIDSFRKQLEEERRDYEEYLETLKKVLNEFLLGKGISTTWEMN